MLRVYRLKIAIMAIVSLAILGCAEKNNPDPRVQPPLVRVGTVQLAQFNPNSFTGTVAARVQSDLGFRVSGKVLERLVDAGQSVKAGQPLMRIDSKDLLLEMQSKQEMVAAAKAKSDQTTEDEIRNQGLVEAGALSASNYDKIKAAAASAKAELKAAQAQAGVAGNFSSYALLVADADGVVMETMAEPGQVVTAGQVVVRIAHAGKREAVVYLPETLRPAIGSTGNAKLYGSEGFSTAKLRQLSSVADSVARTFEARYTLQGSLENAPLGSTVTIKLPHNIYASKSIFQVPLGAIYDFGRGPGLWLINKEQVKWKPVKIISLDDNFAQIEGDLTAGSLLVTLGAHLLHEGDHVRLESNEAIKPAVIGDAK
ncbi:efflux RND transporter periplasmic adaptor subunit [Methylophilus sp. Leaf408]|uniref:efflux RND transporter periplasmic adaptor subunit n=1 Tax=Methylophilus sp. Leaf408 TaxID=2876561 RepID=UPI001E513149|nr:efflux RND transporter periplasmic adaptor subunit [Methylophilus sp. Leaf408]